MMEQNLGQDLGQPLNTFVNDLEQIPASDRLYYKAYSSCQLFINILYYISIANTVIIALLINPLTFDRLDFYLMFLGCVQILRWIHYTNIRNVLMEDRIYYVIAETTRHLAHVSPRILTQQVKMRAPLYVDEMDFKDPFDSDTQRKLRALSYEIKVISINMSKKRKIVNKLQFIAFQIAYFIGLMFLFFYHFADREAQTTRTFILIVILMGTYQYIEFYLLMIFLAVVLPYYFVKNTYLYCQRKYVNYRLERSMKSERYSKMENVCGDNECKICLMPYQKGQKVIVLKCNQMHNFHSHCLKEWIKQAITCPLCRAKLTSM